MIELFSRHDFLNHKSIIVDLLQEIQFIDHAKAERIFRRINSELHWFKDFSYFFFEEKRLIGFIFAREIKDFEEIGRTIEIKYLAVRNDFHRQGIASRLMDALISKAKFAFSNLMLGVYEKNINAQWFYRKYGFVPYRKNGQIQSEIKDISTVSEHLDILLIKRFPLNNILVRPLRSFEEDFLKEMVYLSLFHPEGGTFDRSIMEEKDIKKYYDNWDTKKDLCLVARFEDQNIGAIWARFFPFYDQGYGYVDDHIPEMGMAVLPKFRGRGLGQVLMNHIITRLKHQNVKAVSLSVHKNNPAKKFYENNNFIVYQHEEATVTMIKKLV